jgi:hypothetical protein
MHFDSFTDRELSRVSIWFLDAILAVDEPPEVVLEFFRHLIAECEERRLVVLTVGSVEKIGHDYTEMQFKNFPTKKKSKGH